LSASACALSRPPACAVFLASASAWLASTRRMGLPGVSLIMGARAGVAALAAGADTSGGGVATAATGGGGVLTGAGLRSGIAGWVVLIAATPAGSGLAGGGISSVGMPIKVADRGGVGAGSDLAAGAGALGATTAGAAAGAALLGPAPAISVSCSTTLSVCQ